VANDEPPARPKPVRQPAEVQAVARTKELARADDHGWQMLFGDHPLHGQVALRLTDPVGLMKRPEQEILARRPAEVHSVDRPRADVHDTPHAFSEGSAADVLGADHVDGAVVLQRAPHADHGCEMQDCLNAAHWRGQRVGPADITAVDCHTALAEPADFLLREREHPQPVAPVLQRSHEVAAEQAIASGDQYLHGCLLSSR
jgi:hypothetical protein